MLLISFSFFSLPLFSLSSSSSITFKSFIWSTNKHEHIHILWFISVFLLLYYSFYINYVVVVVIVVSGGGDGGVALCVEFVPFAWQ
jgi:hypothetical protein